MSTQTILGHSFPTPCKRCGGALYRQVDYCPYCGAVHPLDAGPHKRVVIPGSRASAVSKAVQKNGFDPAQPGETGLAAQTAVTGKSADAESPMQAPVLVSPDAPIPPLADPPHTGGHSVLPVRRVLLAIVAIGAIGLAYVAFTLFSDDHESQSGNTEQTANNSQDARTATGTIALYAPSQSTNQAAAVKPAVPVNSAKAAPAIAATPIAPPLPAAPVKLATPQFRDAAQALQAARLAFRANDLSAAQAALGAAQTLQPGNADAQSLLTELKPLAARRDAALQAAQACAAQQSWSCARQHANEAIAIDAGNDTAKTILERVIRETGWAPLKPHAATDSPVIDKSFGYRTS
ncbi:hypothetical protein DSC91_001700 [Paraburkholderia caffeinilytica]|uniref:Zinc ribbon domain-containing protein n=1 Tax=Paraburkholderia caffeinilytica TaxID=1761016 RepID=A0ABQ1N9F6_9BURK|nr:hypothetical protein [Paraburkholderia caffeinilytica]AXL49762.1 hypothetical protein DSC91_001700 [Paraburkholderia caffeinilytica]GGC61111.1 hypothetical protein GCM10011400_56020 [Paraburkholderia caffeinilytica]CAB3795250.1 hypothetical protein LMG28690_04077 [Paraburkholderia caffeinilytica]